MPRHIFTAALAVPLFFGAVRAQIPASASQSAAYAYSIQYILSDRQVKHGFFKTDSYDRISRYLQERISKLLQARGLYLVKPNDAAAFRVTVQLLKAKASDALSNPLRTFGQAGVFLTANVSVADGSGNLLFTREYKGKGLVDLPGGKERIVVLSEAAVDDVARQVDNDDSFSKALSARSQVPARGDQANATPTVDARPAPAGVLPSAAAALASPRTVLLPAGTPVIVAFSDEVLLPAGGFGEQSGDPVSLVLAEDINVGDAVVAKAGSKVAGSIFEANFTKSEKFLEGGILGPGGERARPLRIRVTYIVVGDREVRFRGAEAGAKKHSIVPGGEVLEKIRMVKHREWDIEAGTRVRVFTAEDVTVPLPQPENESLPPSTSKVDQTTPSAAGEAGRTANPKPGDVFVLTDPRDLRVLQHAEGAKLSNVTLPSGRVVPVPPEGMVWRVRKGKIVLEEKECD